jgi:capsule biosynthesis phosphatase
MMRLMKKIIVDLDHTICSAVNKDYPKATPNLELIKKLREYQLNGFEIIIFTARNMQTYQGDLQQIELHTLPIIMDWLKEHAVPFSSVVIGKPWCGSEGFYVDDRAIRPKEFTQLSYGELLQLVAKDMA